MQECNKINNEIDNIIKDFNNSKSIGDKVLFFKKYGVTIDENMIKLLENNCSSVVAGASSNIIEVSKNCGDMLNKLCSDFNNDQTKHTKCLKELRPKIINVNQSNTANIKINCESNGYLSYLLNLNNPGLKLLILAFQQIMSGNKLDCKNLSDVPANKFIKIQDECLNSTMVKSVNYINVCYADKIDQANYSDSYMSCVNKNLVVSEKENDANYNGLDNVINDNKYLIIGITLLIVFMICFMCCLCFIIIGTSYYNVS